MAMTIDEKEFELHLRKEFLNEASELLAATESAFIKLEQEPKNQALIDKIFRTVHTIKGSSAIVGFSSLSGFAHIYETLLNKIRTKDIEATPKIIDTMLSGVDVLGRFVAALRDDPEATIDTREAVVMIQKHLDGKLPTTGTGLRLPPSIVMKTERIPSEAAAAIASTYQNFFPEKRPPRFLVADDDSDIIDVIIQMLAPFEAEITIARSGTDAIAQFDKFRTFDVILTDQRMPDVGGTEFVKHVRSRDSDVPIIVVSGATGREEAITFIRHGVFDFIGKPINDEELIPAVRRALRWARYYQTLQGLSKQLFRVYVDFRKFSIILEKYVPESEGKKIDDFSTALKAVGALVNRLLASDD